MYKDTLLCISRILLNSIITKQIMHIDNGVSKTGNVFINLKNGIHLSKNPLSVLLSSNKAKACVLQKHAEEWLYFYQITHTKS